MRPCEKEPRESWRQQRCLGADSSPHMELKWLVIGPMVTNFSDDLNEVLVIRIRWGDKMR